MRRVLLATAAILALGVAFAGTAQARCSVSCLNRKVKQLSSGLIKAEKTIASLSKTVSQQGQTIAGQSQAIAQQSQAITGLSAQGAQTRAIFECLFEAPLTQYGDPEGSFGYHFNTGTEEIETSALDITEEGDPIAAWFVFDACNTQTVLTLNGAGGVFPGAKSSSPVFSSEARRR